MRRLSMSIIISVGVDVSASGDDVVSLQVRVHPDVLFCYSTHFVELILRVENPSDDPVWAEADINVPDSLSLGPDSELRKGRVKVGIIEGKQSIEKSIRVFGNAYTGPQMYRCSITMFVFSKDGTIESRIEKAKDIRCEMKKEAAL